MILNKMIYINMYLQYIHPTTPQQIESSRLPEVVVNNRISPASFPTDHRPNIIKQSVSKKLMSATKPSVVVFELGGLNFNLTPPA